MKPPRPAPGDIIARVHDIPEGGAVALHFADENSILVARSGEGVFAYINRCTHAAYPLDREDGRVLVQQQRFIVCPHHGASYELETGACAGGPCTGAGLTPIPIEVRDGAISLRE